VVGTFAAVLGRIVTGYIADRFDRRVVACVDFIVQMVKHCWRCRRRQNRNHYGSRLQGQE
jgi:hypothetical protein